MFINKQVKLFQKKEGYVTVESIIVTSFMLMFLFLALGFFLYIHPQTMIQRDVHALATLSERQGGLTPEDVVDFSERIAATYSFINPAEVEVVLESMDGVDDYISYTLLDEEDPTYVTRDSKELMRLIVRTNANNEIVGNVSRYFGVGKELAGYGFTEVVYSERY